MCSLAIMEPCQSSGLAARTGCMSRRTFCHFVVTLTYLSGIFFPFDASQASIVTQKSLYTVRRETRIDPWRFVKIHTNWLQDSSGFGGRELFQEGGNFLGFSGQIRVWIIRKPLVEEILADSKHA